MEFFYLLIALQLKHFIVDFPLQTKYQWSNKGLYGHPGGLTHAFLHGVGTFAIVMYFADWHLAYPLAALDMIIHYHIDWAKMKINAVMRWTPTEHPQFWILLGLDQLLHQLTYIGIIFLLAVD